MRGGDGWGPRHEKEIDHSLLCYQFDDGQPDFFCNGGGPGEVINATGTIYRTWSENDGGRGRRSQTNETKSERDPRW